MMKKLLAVLAAAMLLCFAAAGAAETAAKQEFDFGGLGTVELTTIADYSDDTAELVELLPSRNPTMTQRPALLAGEKLLLSGKATEQVR